MKMKCKKQQDWKSVPIECSSFTTDDFQCFGGIEELTDYKIIKANKNKKFEVIKSGKVKKTKKSKKKSGAKKSKAVVDGKDNTVESVDINKDMDMSAWCNSYVPEVILSALQDSGFQKPTQIQELVLPSAIRDHLDILAAAETGSGKTLAFGIPIITHIIETKERMKATMDEISDCIQQQNKLKALVLLPTRELAIQVKNHLIAAAKYTDVKIIAIVGGMSQEKQRRLLQKSPDIIVATPGRLWQLMEEGEEYLKQVPYVRYLVIDEADRMVEQGHFEEMSKILELINEDKESKRRQNFVFSATLTMVHQLPKRLEVKKKGKPVEKNKLESLMKMIGIGNKSKVFDVTQKKGVVDTLTESQITCSMEEKDVYLYYFVTMYPGRTLVFCNSISSVRRLKSVLEILGCQPVALHASMHQRQRLKNLDVFASSERGLLLATDVAARGLDIKGIEHVVHFQVPRTAEIYVHRSGRTARAQNEGLSLMLIEPREAVFYQRICKTLNKDRVLPPFPVDPDALKVVQERVTLARQIDQLEHREKRLSAQNRWFLKAAEDMEVDLDDKDLLNELGEERDRAVQSRKLKAMKKQMNAMIKRPLLSKKLLGSYPTKFGKLLLPDIFAKEKAVKVMKDSGKAVSVFQKIKKNRQKKK